MMYLIQLGETQVCFQRLWCIQVDVSYKNNNNLQKPPGVLTLIDVPEHCIVLPVTSSRAVDHRSIIIELLSGLNCWPLMQGPAQAGPSILRCYGTMKQASQFGTYLKLAFDLPRKQNSSQDQNTVGQNVNPKHHGSPDLTFLLYELLWPEEILGLAVRSALINTDVHHSNKC